MGGLPARPVSPPGRELPALPGVGLALSGRPGVVSQRGSEVPLMREQLWASPGTLCAHQRTRSKQPGLGWPLETFQSTPDPIRDENVDPKS